MTRTTPARPVDVEEVFPGLAAYRGTTTRLHPRRGRPGVGDSHIGGPMLWPADEPWPTCGEAHGPVTHGYVPDEIRRAREIGVADPGADGARAVERHAVSQAPARAEKPTPTSTPTSTGDEGAVPFVALAQLFRRDVPDLAAGPDGEDMVQLFRCPLPHGPHLERRYHLRWRRADAESADRMLSTPPELPLLPWEAELPEPCVTHPEQVITYPWAEDDTLPAALTARIDAWDDAQEAAHGRDAPCYQSDLSIPPGWRVGGFPSWASTGPMTVDCATCAAPMRLLLTAEGYETDGGTHNWMPLEERDLALEGTTRAGFGLSVVVPTRLRFGRDRDLHVFVCPADGGHPPRWVLS
ncbi:hypothetical protein ACFVZH_26175 [Streptomyces sp. NPDC059534]|uniref:hypothetical protein n=1 Tax=Streptomyces sp. NPDC059534 TaxID=3346859 RepID=UPI0036AA5F90